MSELFVITKAVKKWRQYLFENTFHIYIVDKSLNNLVTQTIQIPEQQKWFTKLIDYRFEIHSKLGKENVMVDALYCMPNDSNSAIYAYVSSLFSIVYSN